MDEAYGRCQYPISPPTRVAGSTGTAIDGYRNGAAWKVKPT